MKKKLFRTSKYSSSVDPLEINQLDRESKIKQSFRNANLIIQRINGEYKVFECGNIGILHDDKDEKKYVHRKNKYEIVKNVKDFLENYLKGFFSFEEITIYDLYGITNSDKLIQKTELKKERYYLQNIDIILPNGQIYPISILTGDGKPSNDNIEYVIFRENMGKILSKSDPDFEKDFLEICKCLDRDKSLKSLVENSMKLKTFFRKAGLEFNPLDNRNKNRFKNKHLIRFFNKVFNNIDKRKE